jgi:hypothetical protein
VEAEEHGGGQDQTKKLMLQVEICVPKSVRVVWGGPCI